MSTNCESNTGKGDRCRNKGFRAVVINDVRFLTCDIATHKSGANGFATKGKKVSRNQQQALSLKGETTKAAQDSIAEAREVNAENAAKAQTKERKFRVTCTFESGGFRCHESSRDLLTREEAQDFKCNRHDGSREKADASTTLTVTCSAWVKNPETGKNVPCKNQETVTRAEAKANAKANNGFKCQDHILVTA